MAVMGANFRDEEGGWEVFLSSGEQRTRVSNERATAAKVAAWLGAAQTVAAMRVAEEARAEARAAK